MKDDRKKQFKQYLYKVMGIIAGAVILAASYNAFIIPYGLLSGGVAGMALIGNYVLGVPLQLGIFFLNIPIYIWGYKELKKGFIISSVFSTIILVLMIPLLGRIIIKPDVDIFLAAIFSGVVSGVGAGLVLKFGSSFGGTDIVSMIMKKKKNISVGAFSFICNIFVLAFSLFFFPLKIALYTSISMWITGRVVDLVIDGFNHYKSVMIITDRSQQIADRILKELHRGVTLLEGLGAYSQTKKLVVNCVITTYEVPRIKDIVLQVDPGAFMFITDTVEVSGRGFTIAVDEPSISPGVSLSI